MNNIKLLLLTVFVLAMTACSQDDTSSEPINEIENLMLVQEFSNTTHTLELFSESGSLQQGYNALTLRIKDNATETFVENAAVSWNPMMQMMQMAHSAPKSSLEKVVDTQTLYSGYLVFQMAENEHEGWTLSFTYTIDGTDYEVSDVISVPAAARKNVTVFTGSDGVNYILALAAPKTPEVASNDLSIALFKKESMMMFPVVEDYSIAIDPRMPSMGNHSSPNNVDPVYDAVSGMYQGELSLTMSGYWKLNLILSNQQGDILKGEAVTDSVESSSLFLELEF